MVTENVLKVSGGHTESEEEKRYLLVSGGLQKTTENECAAIAGDHVTRLVPTAAVVLTKIEQDSDKDARRSSTGGSLWRDIVISGAFVSPRPRRALGRPGPAPPRFTPRLRTDVETCQIC
ncbi:unnamed protein product, partial [Iphiclides podalirius]